MNTKDFRLLFPTAITNSILKDSQLDEMFEYMMTQRENQITHLKEYRVHPEENQWKIEVPLPGSNKEDVAITLKDSDKLSIIADSESTWAVKKELNFKLPSTCDTDSINAEMKNGLLTVIIPKKKSLQDKVVKIK
jgi:HSP20 family molecular chaperone IbpA